MMHVVFLIRHLELGPGYIYRMFRHKLVNVSSTGKNCRSLDIFF